MTRILLALLLSILAIPSAAAAEPSGYGYVVGLLWRGEAWTPERSARIDSLQAGHMANMVRRYEEGWLVGAGPILDPNSSLRGLFFFKADSVAQVMPLIATDPAIAAGRLRIDLVPFIGTSRIGFEYRKAHEANPALPDSMVRYVLALTDPPDTSSDNRIDLLVRERFVIMGGRLLEKSQRAILDPRQMEKTRTLMVLATSDTAEARNMLNAADPAIRSGRRRVELRPWMVARGVIPGH